ncbi:MAG TPA: hypothetical protein VMI92_10805 [Steroidobacteraceae bacterium]|nr:hypothetical protein [Steroidobacteraceae bacterium]
MKKIVTGCVAVTVLLSMASQSGARPARAASSALLVDAPARQLVFKDQSLARDFSATPQHPLRIVLQNATLTGRIDGASLSLDATSHWNVTGDSRLDGAGFDYHAFDRIQGHGYRITYNSENPLSAEMREWAEELPGPSMIMPIMPANVAAAIVSPHYVDGAARGYRGPVRIHSDITVSAADQAVNNSAVYATRGGVAEVSGTAAAPLRIAHTSETSVVYPSGRNRTQDALMKYGVSAVVYANAKGQVRLDHFDLSGTTNGLYAVYDGVVRASNGKVFTTHLHGVQVCYGGKIHLDNVEVETTGPQGSALSSDHGGGWVYANHVNALAHVRSSAGIYADGFSHMRIRNSTVKSLVSPAAVISGAGDIEMTDSTLEGVAGAILYAHPNGNNPFKRGVGVFSNTKLVGQSTAFLLDGKSVDLVLKNGTTVAVPATQKLIIANSPAPGALTLDRAREYLQNDSTFTTYGSQLTGDIEVRDQRTKLILLFNEGTRYRGAITGHGVSLTLDATSHWTLTGDSQLAFFTGDRTQIDTHGFQLTIGDPQPAPAAGPPPDGGPPGGGPSPAQP